MIHDKYTNVRTSRWGTDLVPYTSPREKAMQSRFPEDFSCLMCNRRLVKPNTVCFSCTHLLTRVVDALKQREKITDRYQQIQQAKPIVAKLEAHDAMLRKQEFLERIDNPKPKPHVIENKYCDRCGFAIPTGVGYCEYDNYSIYIVLLS